MSLLSGNKKAKSVKSNRTRKGKFIRENVETVVEVKTVGDIPPALEARKLIGEDNMAKAATVTFKAAKANAMLNGRDYVIPEDIRYLSRELLKDR